MEPRLSSFDESSKRASFSQIFGSKEGGDDNGCQEESQEGRKEGREEGQESREEEVAIRAGAQEPRPSLSSPSPLRGEGWGAINKAHP